MKMMSISIFYPISEWPPTGLQANVYRETIYNRLTLAMEKNDGETHSSSKAC
jgi:hypothetical protein